MMDRHTYVALMKDLMSREPNRVRDANRQLYGQVVNSPAQPGGPENKREADLVLAEIA